MFSLNVPVLGKTYKILFSWSFLLLILLNSVLSGVQGFVITAILTLSILLHEFGHILMAKKYGIDCQEIEFSFLGGAAKVEQDLNVERMSAKHIFAIAAAGPLVSVALALVFGISGLLLESFSKTTYDYFILISAINLIIAIFNSLPVFPLDGGRMLEALSSLYLTKKNTYKLTFFASVLFTGLIAAFDIYAHAYFGLVICGFLALNCWAYYINKVSNK